MQLLLNTTFGWCFVVGEIVVIFGIFMVLHRRALRKYRGLIERERDTNDRSDVPPGSSA
jgi:hypothetical protein